MLRSISVIIGISAVLFCTSAWPDESSSIRIIEPGGFRAMAAGGISVIDRDIHPAVEGSLEIGLMRGLELAAPLALSLKILELSPGSGFYMSGGVSDLRMTNNYDPLYTPAIIFGGQAILGPESAIRGTVDLTYLMRGFDSDAKQGLWLRGNLAMLIDFGPIATIALGISYQRVIDGGGKEPQSDVLKAGWVSDSRVTLGAVRSQPFYDLPTLSIHIKDNVDIIAMIRFDIDLQRNTYDSRWLTGLELSY